MTDLSRERLAELRAVAESVHHPFRWYAAHDLMRGHAMADEDARLIAAMEPRTVLTLIAQCEAGLPASGGVLGENGELLELIDKLGPRSNTPDAFARCAITIRALLAERDGLKAKLANLIQKAGDQAATLIIQGGRVEDERNEAAAALADALGLLREQRDWKPEPSGYRIVTLGDPNSWSARRDALLAKHGPSP